MKVSRNIKHITAVCKSWPVLHVQTRESAATGARIWVVEIQQRLYTIKYSMTSRSSNLDLVLICIYSQFVSFLKLLLIPVRKCCLSFFDLRILISFLVSSNSSTFSFVNFSFTCNDIPAPPNGVIAARLFVIRISFIEVC